MRVCIIGLGLIGGSMAIDLKKRNFASHIVGYDKSELHAKTAQNLGIVDELMELDEAVTSSELVILAIPADATAEPKWSPAASPAAVHLTISNVQRSRFWYVYTFPASLPPSSLP